MGNPEFTGLRIQKDASVHFIERQIDELWSNIRFLLEASGINGSRCYGTLSQPKEIFF